METTAIEPVLSAKEWRAAIRGNAFTNTEYLGQWLALDKRCEVAYIPGAKELKERVDAGIAPDEDMERKAAMFREMPDVKRSRSCDGWALQRLGVRVEGDDSNPIEVGDPGNLGIMVAFANYALPEFDPHKFTWGDVDFLLEAEENDGDGRHTLLACKLAALLPPRDAPHVAP